MAVFVVAGVKGVMAAFVASDVKGTTSGATEEGNVCCGVWSPVELVAMTRVKEGLMGWCAFCVIVLDIWHG